MPLAVLERRMKTRKRNILRTRMQKNFAKSKILKTKIPKIAIKTFYITKNLFFLMHRLHKFNCPGSVNLGRSSFMEGKTFIQLSIFYTYDSQNCMQKNLCLSTKFFQISRKMGQIKQLWAKFYFNAEMGLSLKKKQSFFQVLRHLFAIFFVNLFQICLRMQIMW